MKALKYITAAAALVTLAACQNEDLALGGFKTAPDAIHIQASVGRMPTRSNPTDENLLTFFNRGDRISLSVGENLNSIEQGPVVYTLGENGNWTPENAYLKWNKDEYTFMAYYPADVFTGSEDVPTDQSSAEKIAAADYMWFRQVVSRQAGSPLQMEMQRRTARIVVKDDYIWKDQYLTDDKKMPTHEVKSVRIHSQGKEEMLSITPYNVGGMYYALVNPNETENTDAVFITVTVGPIGSTDETTFDELVIRGIPELKAGNSYNCHLTLGKDKAFVSDVEIVDWENGDDFEDGVATNGYVMFKRSGNFSSYHIYTLEGLLEVNNILANGTWDDVYNADITLYDDFVLPPGTEWTPLGNISTNRSIGKFDGNGHSITGLVVNSTKTGVGLISGCSGGVYNLTLIGCQVTGKNNVGGIAGFASTGDVTNCKIIATKEHPVVIQATGSYVGGLFGQSSFGSYEGCELICEKDASITISGVGNVGGMTGENSHSNLSQCKVINQGGTIEIAAVSADRVGGLVGSHNGTMLRCEVDGLTVTGNTSVGGLIGYVDTEGTVLRYEDEQPYIMNVVKNCTITGWSGSTGAGFGTNVNNGHTPAIIFGEGNTVNGVAVTPSK